MTETAVFDLADGSELALSYRAMRPFPMGKVLISDHLVTYLYAAEHRAYAEAWKTLEFHFACHKTRQTLERHFPEHSTFFPLSDGQLAVQLTKRPDQLRLADVGKLPPEHLAWVIGGLIFLCGYLQWAGLAHLHLAPETCFISGRQLSVALLGGWEFRTPVGTPIRLVPQRTGDLLYGRTVAHAKMNLDQVRATGRELMSPSIPAAWLAWLIHEDGTSSAREAHAEWVDLVMAAGIDLKPRWMMTVEDLYQGVA